MSKILHLNLNGEYFDAIKNGTKPFEYRAKNQYWNKKLLNKKYDFVFFKRGYPKADDLDKIIKVPYRGYEIQTITHPHFDNEPRVVFAIYTDDSINKFKG